MVDIKAIMQFVKRINPEVTEKQIIEAMVGYTGYALTLISTNIKNPT